VPTSRDSSSDEPDRESGGGGARTGQARRFRLTSDADVFLTVVSRGFLGGTAPAFFRYGRWVGCSRARFVGCLNAAV
jgi:hypothetical protein